MPQASRAIGRPYHSPEEVIRWQVSAIELAACERWAKLSLHAQALAIAAAWLDRRSGGEWLQCRSACAGQISALALVTQALLMQTQLTPTQAMRTRVMQMAVMQAALRKSGFLGAIAPHPAFAGLPASQADPTLTADELELYFTSNPNSDYDIWLVKRESGTAPWVRRPRSTNYRAPP